MGVGIVVGLLVLIIEFGFYYFVNKCCNKLNWDKCIYLWIVVINFEMLDVYYVYDNGGEVMFELLFNRRFRENKLIKLKMSYINEIWDFLFIYFVLYIFFIKIGVFWIFVFSDKNVFLRWIIKIIW